MSKVVAHFLLGRAVGSPLPLAGEGDHPQRGGGGGHRRNAWGRPLPSPYGATFPRKREKGPDCKRRGGMA
jgi:hypothetical protein